MMRYSPWDLSNEGDGVDRSAVNEISGYFVECGGDIDVLAETLNRHMADRRFRVAGAILLGGDIPRFGAEFYLYLVTLSKQLIGRDDFRFGEADTRELSGHHRIYERGMLRNKPWYVTPEEYGTSGFSFLNVRIPLRYLRDRGENPGELLGWFNSFLPETERRDEAFFDNDFYHLSDEACLLFHSLFEAYCNGRAALEDCFYRLYANPRLSVWSQVFAADSETAFETMIAMRKTTIGSFREDIRRDRSLITWEILLDGSYHRQTGEYWKGGVLIGLASNMGANRAMLEATLGKRVLVRDACVFLDDPDRSGGIYTFRIRYWYAKRYAMIAMVGAACFAAYAASGAIAESGIFSPLTVVNLSVAAAFSLIACFAGSYIRRINRQNRALREVCGYQHAAFSEFSARANPVSATSREAPARAVLAMANPPGDSRIDAEICELVNVGLASKEIAARLFLSPRTVENRLHRIYKKMGVHSRTELLAKLRAYPAKPEP